MYQILLQFVIYHFKDNLEKMILRWLLTIFLCLILGKTCSVKFHLYIIPVSHSEVTKLSRYVCVVLSCNRRKRHMNQLYVNYKYSARVFKGNK